MATKKPSRHAPKRLDPETQPATTSTWAPKNERDIYEYHNGSHAVAVDPLALHELITQHPELDTELKILSTQSAMVQTGKPEAFRNLVQIVRDVFKVAPFEQDAKGKALGLTNAECLELLAHFFAYLATLKKTLDPSPISAPPGAPPASDVPSPMPSASDSTSTPTVPSSDTPPASPSASPAPSAEPAPPTP